MRLKTSGEHGAIFAFRSGKRLRCESSVPEFGRKTEKRILFLKNKAGELLKTKGNGKKQSENEPETKRAILLKTNKAPKNKAKTNPKTKRSNLLKTKGHKKQTEDGCSVHSQGLL